jgi:cytochrome c oxidase cbb3-type subunit 3
MPLRKPIQTVSRALVTVAAIAGLAAAVVAGPSKGDATAGKKIYNGKCIPCHKADGSGGVKLTGNPSPSWKDPKHVFDPKFNDDVLRDCIVNGKPKSGMPAWGKSGQLKPAEVEDVIAYIHTFFPKKK